MEHQDNICRKVRKLKISKIFNLWSAFVRIKKKLVINGCASAEIYFKNFQILFFKHSIMEDHFVDSVIYSYTKYLLKVYTFEYF